MKSRAWEPGFFDVFDAEIQITGPAMCRELTYLIT